MQNQKNETIMVSLGTAIFAFLAGIAVAVIGIAVLSKLSVEAPDHGATAWGYTHRLPVSNTDCHETLGSYACSVILSSGPTRYVRCNEGQCEEILPQ